MNPPTWQGQFYGIDDLWALSAAQIKAAVTLDRLAAHDGTVRITADEVAKLAGVSRPRLSEAVAYLTARGNIQQRSKGDKTPGFTLLRREFNTKSKIEIALERGDAKLINGGLVWTRKADRGVA